MTQPKKNPYKVLGISKNASLKDIKKAFRDLSAKYDPDTNGNKYLVKFYEVSEAYKILKQEMKDIYEILGVRENADMDEIDAEFKRRMEYLVLERKEDQEKGQAKIDLLRKAYYRLKSRLEEERKGGAVLWRHAGPWGEQPEFRILRREICCGCNSVSK